MKQGDVILPTLFSIFINDLAKDIKNLNLGVEIEPVFNVSIPLLFADDIVLLSPTEEQLQLLLNFLSNWCHINKMEVNINKTKIIHFRKKILRENSC